MMVWGCKKEGVLVGGRHRFNQWKAGESKGSQWSHLRWGGSGILNKEGVPSLGGVTGGGQGKFN